MPTIKVKRNNIDVDLDTTVLSQGEPFWNYYNGKSVFLIGDGVTPIRDLPRYTPDKGGDADSVNGYTIAELSKEEYDFLPVKDGKTIYLVKKEE